MIDEERAAWVKPAKRKWVEVYRLRGGMVIQMVIVEFIRGKKRPEREKED